MKSQVMSHVASVRRRSIILNVRNKTRGSAIRKAREDCLLYTMDGLSDSLEIWADHPIMSSSSRNENVVSCSLDMIGKNDPTIAKLISMKKNARIANSDVPTRFHDSPHILGASFGLRNDSRTSSERSFISS